MKTAFEIINEILKEELDFISDGKIDDVTNAIVKKLRIENVETIDLSDMKSSKKYTPLDNYIIYGKAATGKTTQLIRMINELLQVNPELKIGVCEIYPEIKTDIPQVLSVHKPSADLDLFVCTCDYYIIKVAYNMGIPVWCEVNGIEKGIETMKQNIPCLRHFKEIKK